MQNSIGSALITGPLIRLCSLGNTTIMPILEQREPSCESIKDYFVSSAHFAIHAPHKLGNLMVKFPQKLLKAPLVRCIQSMSKLAHGPRSTSISVKYSHRMHHRRPKEPVCFEHEGENTNTALRPFKPATPNAGQHPDTGLSVAEADPPCVTKPIEETQIQTPPYKPVLVLRNSSNVSQRKNMSVRFIMSADALQPTRPKHSIVDQRPLPFYANEVLLDSFTSISLILTCIAYFIYYQSIF